MPDTAPPLPFSGAVRPARPDDRGAVDAIHDREWGGPYVVGHGVRYDLRTLPTLVATNGEPRAMPGVLPSDDTGSVVGALVWHAEGDALEVVSVATSTRGGGVGTALLAAAVAEARAQGLRRIWLVTTNDNLPALRFYQRRGLRIVAVDPGAVDRARELKPGIPLVGVAGIPLHDELILEMRLDVTTSVEARVSAPDDEGR